MTHIHPNTKRVGKIIQAAQDYVNDELETKEFIEQILEIERKYDADMRERVVKAGDPRRRQKVKI